MLTAIALIGAAYLLAAALRRAAPLAAGLAIGWWVWLSAHDFWMSFAAGAIAFVSIAAVIDTGVASRRVVTRRLAIGFELCASVTFAVWLTYLASKPSADVSALIFAAGLAAVVSAGIVLAKRTAPR